MEYSQPFCPGQILSLVRKHYLGRRVQKVEVLSSYPRLDYCLWGSSVALPTASVSCWSIKYKQFFSYNTYTVRPYQTFSKVPSVSGMRIKMIAPTLKIVSWHQRKKSPEGSGMKWERKKEERRRTDLPLDNSCTDVPTPPNLTFMWCCTLAIRGFSCEQHLYLLLLN